MTTIHLRGLAERADCDEQPLGPDVTVPETVPVLLEFDRKNGPVGTAKLSRDEQGIWADVTIDLDGSHGPLMRKAIERGTFRQMWPAFAVSIAHTVVSKSDEHPTGVITAGEVANMALCRANRDPDLPPYEVIHD